VVAYSPLGQGVLAGRTSVPGPFGLGRPGMLASRRPGIGALRAALAEVARAHRATPAQVALAWVISHPNTVAIPGARTLAQLEENAAAAELDLAADEVASLTDAAHAMGGRG
jgi:aryl-alcohol dehydrogenase-like predicted oxidoreductase